MNIINIIIAIIFGYLLGSIPWALIIGKTFYKVDVRKHGSKNLGGSNAGRVLGSKAGLAVIILDTLKSFIIVTYCALILKDTTAATLAGMFACIGHCFPLFANFKGGKGVATILGYNIAMSLFVSGEFLLLTLLPAFCFILVLSITKWVSLSSMVYLLMVCVFSYYIYGFSATTPTYILLWLFVCYRHKSNILRIIKGEERKITWIK